LPKSFLGKGWKFPVRATADKKIAMSQYEKDIKEAIWINTATVNLVEMTVQESLTIWEHRIELIKVEVSTEDSANGKLDVIIDYRVRTTNNRFNLVYPFYLKEGS
jgi:hypothetical protein